MIALSGIVTRDSMVLSDIMVPMAIPSFGGMIIEIMTMLVVPVLYCCAMEGKLKLGIDDPRFAENA